MTLALEDDCVQWVSCACKYYIADRPFLMMVVKARALLVACFKVFNLELRHFDELLTLQKPYKRL